MQYLNRFLEDVGSFNLGVAGGGNLIGDNIGADGEGGAGLVAGIAQPPLDALGIDYNDGRQGHRLQRAVAARRPRRAALHAQRCLRDDRLRRRRPGAPHRQRPLPDLLAARPSAPVVTFVEQIDAQTNPF